MTTIETGSAQYQEPDPSEISHEKIVREIGEIPTRRLMAIEDGYAIYEPLQDGVRRYPPVRVGVSADPEAIKRYLDILPSPERGRLDKPSSNGSGPEA